MYKYLTKVNDVDRKKNVNDPLTHPTFVFKKIDHVKDK